MPRYHVIASTEYGQYITTTNAASPREAAELDADEYDRISIPYCVKYVVVGRYGGDPTFRQDHEEFDVLESFPKRRKILYEGTIKIPGKAAS